MNRKCISCREASRILLALTFPLFFASCGADISNNPASSKQAETDAETAKIAEQPEAVVADTKYSNGAPIRYVVLGKQVWTADNLKVTKFSDGTPITNAQNTDAWTKAGKSRSAAYCFAGGDEAAGRNEYGHLYNGYAITSEHDLCPRGWHIPTSEDVEQLIAHLGKDPGTKLKSSFGWKTSVEFGSGNGTDAVGFWFVPAGTRNQKGRFDAMSLKGNLATSSSSGTEVDAYQLQYVSTGMDKFSAPLEVGLSCRCVKDDGSTKELDKANQVVPQRSVEELEEDEAAD
jgi:uncharacterized protein (TIGR02145 family)